MEQKELLDLLTEGSGRRNIPISKARLLAEMLGGGLASYHPGTDDVAFLSAAANLGPHLEVAQDAMTVPSSSQTIPFMELLKLATLRMTSADRWDLTYLGHVVVKNGIRISRSVKREGAKVEDAKYSVDRQDVWASLNSMKSFKIAALGLAAAVEEMLHPSIVTPRRSCHCFALSRPCTQNTTQWSRLHRSSCYFVTK